MLKYFCYLSILLAAGCSTTNVPRSITDSDFNSENVDKIFIVKNLRNYDRINDKEYQKASNLYDSTLAADFSRIGVSPQISQKSLGNEGKDYIERLNRYYDNRVQRQKGVLDDRLSFPMSEVTDNHSYILIVEVDLEESGVCNASGLSCVDIKNYIGKVRTYLIDSKENKTKWFQVFDTGYIKHSDINTGNLSFDKFSRGLVYNLKYGTDLHQDSFKIFDSKRLLKVELKNGNAYEGYVKSTEGFSINFINSSGKDSLHVHLNDMNKVSYSDGEVVFPIYH